MWSWFRSGKSAEYKAYTTKFDVVVPGSELTRNLEPDAKAVWLDQVAVYEAATAVERTKASLAAIPVVDELRRRLPDVADTVAVSILVDHSGSLHGQRAIIACLLAEVIGDFLSRLGVKFEVLGFTTRAWKGGFARQQWQALGRRRNPGRLNDLLHIVYRDASSTFPGVPWAVRNLLRHDLLKENIDGEAILWAAERLKPLRRGRNIVLIISDGAPVDDSTLHENGGDYLWRHLKTVVADLTETEGFQVAAIGIDYSVSHLYPQSIEVARLDQLSEGLADFLRSLFD
ncbi:cobaltochelatase CobT-related protein [Marivivens marinus]|uniref:cobaltochelatase CobT-related protein n=1 Tax=Marivivens marinus TaxID=3110173 RepID=UPI003B845DF5